MSVISSKKADQKEGPEKILFYMGYVFFIADAVISILTLILGWTFLTQNVMILLIYFLLLAALSFSLGSILKDNAYSPKIIKNWFYGFIGLSILLGIILGAYMW